MNLRIDDLFD
jgi:hypothetical protein